MIELTKGPWYCPDCNKNVSRKNRSTHLRTRQHINAANRVFGEAGRLSDQLFTRFLNQFDARKFHGDEAMIYNHYRELTE